MAFNLKEITIIWDRQISLFLHYAFYFLKKYLEFTRYFKLERPQEEKKYNFSF